MNNSTYAILATLLLSTATAIAGPTPQQSPLSESFIQWQNDTNRLPRSIAGRPSGLQPSPTDITDFLCQNPVVQKTRAALPVTFDLRTAGLVTPVKSQGETGNCWAFTTIASIEGAALVANMESFDLSEKNLRNRTRFDRSITAGDLSEDGGNIDKSLAYLTRWDGPVQESLDPFDDTDPTSDSFSPILRVGESRIFTGKDAIKQALTEYGTLFTNMCSADSYYRYGTNTTYYLPGNYTTNHAVTIVGWDDTITIATAPVKGAWLIKNSWGNLWGDNGYFWLSYADSSAVNTANSFGKITVPTSKESIYYHDTLGATGSLGYNNPTAHGAVSFVMRRNEQLRSVGTFVRGNNASLTVTICKKRELAAYYSDMYAFTDTLSTHSVQLQEAGYYTIDLPSPVKTALNDTIHVIVGYSIPEAIYPIPTERAIANYSSAVTTKPLESFISYDGEAFTDIHTSLKQSAAIKLIAEEYEPTDMRTSPRNSVKQNPTIRDNTLIINAKPGSAASYALFSMRGQKIGGMENLICRSGTRVELPSVAPGIYVVRVTIDGYRHTISHIVH